MFQLTFLFLIISPTVSPQSDTNLIGTWKIKNPAMNGDVYYKRLIISNDSTMCLKLCSSIDTVKNISYRRIGNKLYIGDYIYIVKHTNGLLYLYKVDAPWNKTYMDKQVFTLLEK